jgi:DNA-binding YbaB/EbfC family protein
MKDIQKMQQQAMKALQEMQQIQEQIGKEVVEGSAGGGAVTVKATGALELTEVRIDPAAIDPDDAEALADLVLAAVNNALAGARSLQEKRLGGVMGGLGGLGLPGF